MHATPRTEPEEIRARCEQTVSRIGEVLLGKSDAIRLALTCLLANGHLLIEDQPGVGKTTLSHALAQMLGLDYQRVQFTSDLLPADVVGTMVFDRDTGQFHFRQGALFAELVLADEINRAPPKTQSALLEAMEERQVSIEGTTHPLPNPFFVIATQNPREQAGTFPLPQSQLDRFLMRISLGHPAPEAEHELLAGHDRRAAIAGMTAVMAPHELLALQRSARAVHASTPLLHYIQAILAATRTSPFTHGLSPRAGLSLLAAARAWALLAGREHVLPEDIQAVLSSVVDHRLDPISTADGLQQPGAYLRSSVSIP